MEWKGIKFKINAYVVDIMLAQQEICRLILELHSGHERISYCNMSSVDGAKNTKNMGLGGFAVEAKNT